MEEERAERMDGVWRGIGGRGRSGRSVYVSISVIAAVYWIVSCFSQPGRDGDLHGG